MKYRLVYSKSSKHFYIIPVERLDDRKKWYRLFEPRGFKTPEWAEVVSQSALANGINNALAYLTFDSYDLAVRLKK